MRLFQRQSADEPAMQTDVDVSSRWYVLSRQRKVYLPSGNNQVRTYAQRHFVWRRWQRVMGEFGLWWFDMAGRGKCLNRQELERVVPHAGEALAELNRLDASGECKSAFSIGSSGPYQKICALVVSEAGTGRAFIKYSVAAGADQNIDIEADWLSTLAQYDSLRGRIPQVIGRGHFPNGRAYLLTDVAPSQETVRDFGVLHEQFLSKLGHATQEWMPYGKSAEALRLANMLADQKEVLGPVVFADLQVGLDHALARLGAWTCPLVVAHRDFAPWNVRWSPSGVFVFDWEYAVGQASPLHDFFHYRLVQRALSKWHRLRPDHLTHLKCSGLEYARRNYPETRWESEQVSALLMVYLLDVVLFYAASGRLFDPQHPVLSAYHRLIRSRMEWLGA